jgi:phospholipase/carboxylesterase
MLYSELIPAADKKSRRMMIMLHGLGDSIEGYRWLPEAMDTPWLNYLLVNAPDEYYGGRSWFEYPGDMIPGVLRSRKMLFELLADLIDKGFPADQITLGGFSQGCMMTLDVGFRFPQKLAGMMGISGWVIEKDQLLAELSPVARQQRVLMTHGEFDEVLPFAPVRRQVQCLQRAGLNITWREFPKGHTIYGTEEITLMREFVRAGYPVVGV